MLFCFVFFERHHSYMNKFIVLLKWKGELCAWLFGTVYVQTMLPIYFSLNPCIFYFHRGNYFVWFIQPHPTPKSLHSRNYHCPNRFVVRLSLVRIAFSLFLVLVSFPVFSIFGLFCLMRKQKYLNYLSI